MSGALRTLGFRLRRHTFDGAHDGVRRSTDYATVLIDGRPLTELLTAFEDLELRRTMRSEVERQTTELGRPASTAQPTSWRDPDAARLLRSAHLFGVPARGWDFVAEPAVGFVGLLVCSCGTEGCEAVIADFEERGGQIAWRRIRTATVDKHGPIPRFAATARPDLVFDATQYREAIARASKGKIFSGTPTPDLPLSAKR